MTSEIITTNLDQNKSREYKVQVLASSICELYGHGYTFSASLYGNVVNVANQIIDSVESGKVGSFVVSKSEDGKVQFCQVDSTPDDCRIFAVIGFNGGSANVSSIRDKEQSWLNAGF